MDDLKHSFQDRHYVADSGYIDDLGIYIPTDPFLGHATVGSSWDNKTDNKPTLGPEKY